MAAVGFARAGARAACLAAARKVELQEHRAGDGLVVLFARKQPFSKTPYFAISADPDDLFASRTARSPGYAGKLRGDARGHHYVLYDHGKAPTKIQSTRDSPDGGLPPSLIDGKPLRRELGLFSFRYGAESTQGSSHAVSTGI